MSGLKWETLDDVEQKLGYKVIIEVSS